MPISYRLVGLANGSVDTKDHEINFELSVAGGNPISFVSKYGVACQMAAALGRMIAELRNILDAEKKMESISAELVAGAHIQKDRWKDVVLLQLITENGVPYNFAVPTHAVTDIVDRLKTESLKKAQVGNA